MSNKVRTDEYFDNAFHFAAVPSAQVWKDFNVSKRNKGDKIPAIDIEGLEVVNSGIVGIYDNTREPSDYSLFAEDQTQRFLVTEKLPFIAGVEWGSLEVEQNDIDNADIYFVHEANGGWTKYLSEKLAPKGAYDSYVATTTDNPVLTETEWIESLKSEGDMKWAVFNTNIKGRLLEHIDWTGFNIPDPGDANFRMTAFVPVKIGDIVNIKAYSPYPVLSIFTADMQEVAWVQGVGLNTLTNKNHTMLFDGFVVGVTTNLAAQNYSLTVTPSPATQAKNIYYSAFSEIQDFDIDLRKNAFRKEVEISGAATFNLVSIGFFGNVNAFRVKATALTLPSTVILHPNSDLFLNSVFNKLTFYNEFGNVYCLIEND